VSRPLVDLSVPLPHDLDAEKTLLGTLLMFPERLDDVSELPTSALYRQEHRSLLSAMRSLRAEAKIVEPVTIKTVMGAAAWEDLGGFAYINAITDGRVRSEHVTAHAAIIRQTAAARETVRLCLKTTTHLLQDPQVIGNGLPAYHREAFEQIIRTLGVPTAAAAGLEADDLMDAVDPWHTPRRGQARRKPG